MPNVIITVCFSGAVLLREHFGGKMKIQHVYEKVGAHLRWSAKDPKGYRAHLSQALKEYGDRLGATSFSVHLRGLVSMVAGGAFADQPPVPPRGLMFRVSGGKDANVFLGSGKQTLDDFAAALSAHGKTYSDFEKILDFGCGCGRVLRWLRADLQPERLSGSDIDKAAIKWLQWNMPGVDVRTNGGLPPLLFETGSFDLVLGYSVFSHLDEEYQDAWLTELARVTKPGAMLLLTVHGYHNWAYTKQHILNQIDALPSLNAQFKTNGFLYWKHDAWGSHFPDFYHTAWHSPDYIRRRWSKWFDVLDIREAGARPTQDLIVLKKP